MNAAGRDPDQRGAGHDQRHPAFAAGTFRQPEGRPTASATGAARTFGATVFENVFDTGRTPLSLAASASGEPGVTRAAAITRRPAFAGFVAASAAAPGVVLSSHSEALKATAKTFSPAVKSLHTVFIGTRSGEKQGSPA